MGTTALHLPTEFDQDLKARDKRYWEDATAMTVRPKAEGAEGVRALVESLAPEYGIAPELARAVAEVESNFNPRALSRAGAQGVMQLMPETAKQYQVGDAWNPEDNIRGGLKYLAKLQQQFPGRVDLQLAAYNAGEGAVQKHGNTIPPYPETQEYVQKVQARLAGMKYISKRVQAGGGAPPSQMAQASDEAAAEEPWQASRRPMEPPLEEPQWQRIAPRFGTGTLETIESGLKGIEPLEKRLGVSTGLGGLATATAQDLHTYVTEKIAPRGTEHTLLDSVATSLGAALPLFAPGVATESVLAGMATSAPKIAAALGWTTMGVVQGVTGAGSTYDALKPIVGEEEAAKRASHAFAVNTLLGTVGGALGTFGSRGVPEGLSRVVMGAVSQGTQGGIAYDLNRREFWVDANHSGAEALLAQGWEKEGTRIVQPYRFKDQLEAALVQGVVGATLGGIQELNKLPLPKSLEPYAKDEGFTAQRAVEAALKPGVPPTDVSPETWQRWGKAVLDLLPEGGQGGLIQQILKSERGSLGVPKSPTLEQGGEGLTPGKYRTEAGSWRIPLREMPSQELELQDFIRQQGKINLSRETDVPGELRALIAPAEVGRELSLQNDRTGISLQQMAERAEQQGFLASADKEQLLWGLNRSVAQGHNVYSQKATGRVPLVDSPHVEAAYRHTLEAIQTLEGRTLEQTRGVRPHAEVMAEVQALLDQGFWTLDDFREVLPGTNLDDTMLGVVMLSMSKVGEQLQIAAQHVVNTGGHPSSAEVMDYLTIKAQFAEMIPVRAGVVAEAGRSLSFLNEPASAYNRYLQELHENMNTQQGGRSVLSMARADLAIATPTERLATQVATTAKAAAEFARWQTVNENMGDWWANYQGEMVERPPLLDAPEDLAREQKHLREDAQQQRLERGLQEFLTRNALTPSQGELKEMARLLLSPEEAAIAERKAGAPRRWDQWLQAHGVTFTPRLDPGEGTGQALLLNPEDYTQTPATNLLGLVQANLGIARPGFAEMFTEQYTAAKLGPTSWIKNVVGNTIMGTYAFPVRMLAEGISEVRQGVRSGLGYEPTAGVEYGETVAMLWALVHGTSQHWKNAGENWKTGESQFGRQGTGKTDVYPKAVTGENVAALGLPIDPNGPTAKAIDFWGEYVGWLSGGRQTHRVLNTGDELAKSWNFSIESAALAHAEAARLNLDGLPTAEQIATIMADPTLAARIDKGALDYAVKMTLQQQTPEEGIGALFAKMAGKTFRIPGTEQEFPIGRFFLPFIKIPVNGASFIIDNSVLALAQQKTYSTIAKGGRDADLAMSQMIIGTLTMTAMAGYVASGQCVGRAPSDPVQRDIFLKEHAEYTCNVLGRWVPYDIFGPVGDLLSLVADAGQLIGELKGEDASKLVAAIYFSVNKNIWNKTAAKNVVDFFEAMQPGRGDESADQILGNLNRYARQQVGQAVGSWATRAAVRAMDPERKAIKEVMDGIYAQFPWGSTSVPRERSINGEPQLYGLGVGPDLMRPFVRAVIPGKWQDSELSPADRAIKANDMQLRHAPATLDRDAMPMKGDTPQSTEEIASLKGLKPTVLSARAHEQYKVIRALNEPEARKLANWMPGDADIIPRQAIVLATQRVALSQAHENPPHEAMSLGDMLDWLTTTTRFQEASGGRGGGKENMFQVAVQQYGTIGKAVFLHLRPDLGEQHLQTEILHKSRLLPPAEQGPRALMEEGRLRARGAVERAYLGFPERPTVGGNPR